MKIMALRSNNGKEYVNRDLEGCLKQHGIRHQRTNDYTSEHNGMAVRVNRLIVERARCMLFEAELSKAFWAEAVSTAVYLMNRFQTRFETISNGRVSNRTRPTLEFSEPMAFVPKPKRRKWDPKSRECILTDFDEETKGYRLYDPKAAPRSEVHQRSLPK